MAPMPLDPLVRLGAGVELVERFEWFICRDEKVLENGSPMNRSSSNSSRRCRVFV